MKAMASLVDELHNLQDRLTFLSRYDRLVLDLAASLAEQLQEIRTGSPPQRITTITEEDYLDRLPETWELKDGVPIPKHWMARVEERPGANSGIE